MPSSAPVQAARAIGTFQPVRGRVNLNFGDDWRTDFTITLEAKARRLFAKAGLDAWCSRAGGSGSAAG